MRLISYKNRKENDIQTGLLINDDQELIPLITLGLPSDMNDLIKIDTLLSYALGVKPNVDRLAANEGKEDARRD